MSLFRKDVLPFLFWSFAFVAATIGADLILHRLQLAVVGRYLGAAGLFAVILSLLPYSLRKRSIIRFGDPVALLRLHQIGGWLGALLISVHAGIHFNALLPWIALGIMLVDVASGFGGAFLFHKERLHLEENRLALIEAGTPPAELERITFWDALTLDLTKKWRMAHSAMAAGFALFAVAHILTVFMFWSWR